MPFYYLPNLTANETQVCEPWTSEIVRPVLADKNAFHAWCNNGTTEHAFISAVEGQIAGLRVSETNPPRRLHGLVLDYDAVPDAPPEQGILLRAPSDLRPAWVSRTFSGNCRVLFVFAEPVTLFTSDISTAFLSKCQRELKMRRLLPGFESEALFDLSKYFEIGDHWTPIGDGLGTIPANLLESWMADACRKHDWEKDGPCIPMDVLRVECNRLFPNRWPNGWAAFELGARGPRFWDESATDQTSAIVRDSGMQYYSDGGGFMSWEGIFGSQFVRRWLEDRRGEAIRAFHYDGDDFWTKGNDGKWDTRTEKEVRRHLIIKERLNKHSAGREESEVEQAVYDITEARRVEAALPFIYRPDGILEFNQMKCLNISTRKPVVPVVDYIDWAEGFPRIANLLDRGFATVPGVDGNPDPYRQRNHFLSWLKHFYLGAWSQEPTRGLALFVAGPANTGKTLLNTAIVGRLMGGFEDASKFLMNTDKYNDKLFQVGLWTMDDAITPGDFKSQATLSQMIKQVVANDAFIYRPMYGSGRNLQWLGRPFLTTNDDPESLRILPQTDINIIDKIMLLMMQRIEVPGWEMTDAQIDIELPFFAAFLRDWVPPVYCQPTNIRFGVAPYSHPILLASAESTSPTASFEELMLLWRKEFFAAGGVGEHDADWAGNPSELQKVIIRNDSLRPIMMHNYHSPVAVGMHLNKLMKLGRPYLSRTGNRKYVIARPNLSDAS